MALTQIKSSNITDGTIVNDDVSASAAIASTKLSGVESGLTSVQVFTSSGTWTKPTGITKIIVEVQGAGGSGSRHGTGANVCSGSGGGYAQKFLDVTDIDTVTVVVGAGGASQTSSDTAGLAGGLSSFVKATGSGSFTSVIGNGGLGGIISGWGAGPIGGTGTGGDLNIAGGRGWMGGDNAKVGEAFLGTPGQSSSYSTGVVLDGLGYGAAGGWCLYNSGFRCRRTQELFMYRNTNRINFFNKYLRGTFYVPFFVS